MRNSHKYLKVLRTFHEVVLPRTYAEIGVQYGKSLRLALPGTICVGIDPAYSILARISRAQLFKMTSDDFFESHNLTTILSSLPLDLAFIDGQHLFEYALRDFLNLESYCSKDSIILIHDCYPLDSKTSSRDRQTKIWSGDVWKLILCLQRFRPDLRVETLDVPPTGLGVIRQLDPASKVLNERYEEACSLFINMEFSELEGDPAESLNLVGNESVFGSLGPPFRKGHANVLDSEGVNGH